MFYSHVYQILIPCLLLFQGVLNFCFPKNAVTNRVIGSVTTAVGQNWLWRSQVVDKKKS